MSLYRSKIKTRRRRNVTTMLSFAKMRTVGENRKEKILGNTEQDHCNHPRSLPGHEERNTLFMDYYSNQRKTSFASSMAGVEEGVPAFSSFVIFTRVCLITVRKSLLNRDGCFSHPHLSFGGLSRGQVLTIFIKQTPNPLNIERSISLKCVASRHL